MSRFTPTMRSLPCLIVGRCVCSPMSLGWRSWVRKQMGRVCTTCVRANEKVSKMWFLLLYCRFKKKNVPFVVLSSSSSSPSCVSHFFSFLWQNGFTHSACTEDISVNMTISFSFWRPESPIYLLLVLRLSVFYIRSSYVRLYIYLFTAIFTFLWSRINVQPHVFRFCMLW